jgi:hypothetical protein
MRTSPRIHERPISIASRGWVSRGCSWSKGAGCVPRRGRPTPQAAGGARLSMFRRGAW